MLFTSSSHALTARTLCGTATLVLLFGQTAWAQTPPAPASGASSAQRARPEPLTQTIRIEDAGNRIDEVRVGGQTRSITVQPKGGMPSYQVAPTTGERRWNVLGF